MSHRRGPSPIAVTFFVLSLMALLMMIGLFCCRARGDTTTVTVANCAGGQVDFGPFTGTSESISVETADDLSSPWINRTNCLVPFRSGFSFTDTTYTADLSQRFYRVVERAPGSNAVVRPRFRGSRPADSFCQTESVVIEDGQTYHTREVWK